MTSNLLTLNSSNTGTEFLLIRQNKQLALIHYSSLNTAHFARNFQRSPYLFRRNFISLHILLLSQSSTSLDLPLPRFQNSQYN